MIEESRDSDIRQDHIDFSNETLKKFTRPSMYSRSKRARNRRDMHSLQAGI